MAKLRAGLIGLGMMGRHHARVLGSLDDVDLVAVADPAGDPHGIAGDRPLLGSVEDLIATGLDYCMVAVPTVYHEPVGLALAAAGVHAMIEKPLAQDVESAQRLADEHGVGSGVYYPIPNHRLPSFRLTLDLPQTELAAEQALSLPVHPALSQDDVAAVIEAVAAVARAGA